MTFEAGKFYKTRGNHKVFVYEILESADLPVLGKMMGLGDMSWMKGAWSLTGQGAPPKMFPTLFNLVGPWTEEDEVKHVKLYQDWAEYEAKKKRRK